MNPKRLFRDCYLYELVDSDFPLVDWQAAIAERSLRLAKTRILDGSSNTSVDDDEHIYRLMDGNFVQQELAWLRNLYLGSFRNLASQAFEREIDIDQATVSQVNINVLDDPNHSYDWHVDSNHCTGLLFCNSLTTDDGGALIFKFDGKIEKIIPRAGNLLFFDARDKPHTIEPIKKGVHRITAVMNYNFSGEKVQRPGDLDGFLYS